MYDHNYKNRSFNIDGIGYDFCLKESGRQKRKTGTWSNKTIRKLLGLIYCLP